MPADAPVAKRCADLAEATPVLDHHLRPFPRPRHTVSAPLPGDKGVPDDLAHLSQQVLEPLAVRQGLQLFFDQPLLLPAARSAKPKLGDVSGYEWEATAERK